MARTRGVVAAGAAAVMVAVGLAAAPAIADSPPQPDPVPISAVTQTRVTLTFTGNGCKGCVITPQQLILASDNGGQEVSWNDDFSTKRKVRGDSVTFRVPTESTRGMYFYIDEPAFDSDGFYDAAPMVVFQYAGYQPGEWVERSQAVKASSGSPCWAGTTEASVSLSVNVRKVRVEGVSDTRVRQPLAWVAPTEEAFGGFMNTDRGVIAANGDPGCGGTS
ncbi:MAG: hypothetical protein L7U42_06685 [Candidatus Nanopelagicales bacterium]|nr:hypothetical protein [Candidatus Nanopelagicales bacterium]